MSNNINVIRLRYMGEENYTLGLYPGRVYAVNITCEFGYITVMWNTNKCLYTSLLQLNNEWVDP